MDAYLNSFAASILTNNHVEFEANLYLIALNSTMTLPTSSNFIEEMMSSDISNIHVDDMNAEEPRGLKRSADEEDPRVEIYHRQRPSTFNERREFLAAASDKLRKFNNSLHTQVLVCNFIRSVHNDMETDGIFVPELYDENNKRRGPFIPEWRPHRTTTSDPPLNNSVNSSDVDSRPGTPSVISSTQRDLDSAESDFSSEYERCFSDADSLKINSLQTSYERTENGALWTEDNDRLSRLNWCSVLTSSFNGSDSSTSDYISDDSTSSNNLTLLMPAAMEMEYFDLPNSTHLNADCSAENTSPSGSSPTSSEDEIFSDVDLTLYDYDCHAMSPPSVAMDPLTAEELVWSLSSDQRTELSNDQRTELSDDQGIELSDDQGTELSDDERTEELSYDQKQVNSSDSDCLASIST